MAKIGRPKGSGCLYTEAIADALCQWLSEGKPLRAFCRQPGMPKKSTVAEWRKKDEAFDGRVARARDDGFDAVADRCVEIADDSKDARLQVETRLKLLACWDPRRYGNKAQVEHSGGVSLNVVTGVPEPDVAPD